MMQINQFQSVQFSLLAIHFHLHSPGVARVLFLCAVYKLTYLLTYLQVHHVPRHGGELVPFVTARRCVSTVLLSSGVRLSVRPSVCLSVCYVRVLYPDG